MKELSPKKALKLDESEIIVKAADIVMEELSAKGLDGIVPVIEVLPIRTVGVQGDNRTYGHPLVLGFGGPDGKSAETKFAEMPLEMLGETLARISTRVTNEIKEINRVLWEIAPSEKIRRYQRD